MASDAQPSDGIGLLSFSSFSHFVMLGHRGLLHQCFGRCLQDKHHVQIHWGKVLFCGRGAALTSRTKRGKIVCPLTHLFIPWNLEGSFKKKKNRSHLWHSKVVCFYLSIISLCFSLCLMLCCLFWGATLSSVSVTPVKHTPVMCH